MGQHVNPDAGLAGKRILLVPGIGHAGGYFTASEELAMQEAEKTIQIAGYTTGSANPAQINEAIQKAW
jgi:hypothetical protein